MGAIADRVREVTGRVEKKFDPLQPRDPHTGQWIPSGFNPSKDYQPWTTARNPSPRFTPKRPPRTKYEAWKETPSPARVVLRTDIERRAGKLKEGESVRLPEGVLFTRLTRGRGYRIDGPTGVHHKFTLQSAAECAHEEENIARADRFGNTIPGNPMGPLTGVDVPPIDPVGDQIGGMLHGGWVTLPNGTMVHRKPGDSGDEFEVISLGGGTESFPATDKTSTILAAKRAETKAGPHASLGTGDRNPSPNPDSVGPLGPLPQQFIGTRKTMHRISAQVVAPARPGHKIALYATPGGFGTPKYSYLGRESQVRTEADHIIREVDGKTTREKILGIHPESAKALANFFSLADASLRRLSDENPNSTVSPTWPEPADASPAILWPEHFDIGTIFGGPGFKANFGASPGDEAHPEPYFYVGPWAAPPPSGVWNGRGFNGAELTYAEVLAASDQKKAVMDFFKSRMETLRKEGS